MPRIPRDISGRKLASLLEKYGYRITRETGSHIRLECRIQKTSHKITVSDHRVIKIGTLNNILNDLATHHGIKKKELIEELFG